MLTKKLVNSGCDVKNIRYGDSLVFRLSFLFDCIGNKNRKSPSFSLRIFNYFLLVIAKFKNVLVFGKSGNNVIANAKQNDASRVRSNA